LRRWRIEDSIGFPAWGRVRLLGVVLCASKIGINRLTQKLKCALFFATRNCLKLQEMRKVLLPPSQHSCRNVKVAVAPEAGRL
jgi:hypothetical protein